MLSKRFVQQHQGNQILICVVINFYHHLVKLAKKFVTFCNVSFFTLSLMFGQIFLLLPFHLPFFV